MYLHSLLQVYWGSILEGTTLTVNNAVNSSPLLSEEEYIIGDLNPLDKVSAIVIAISYVGSKSEGVEVAKGETYGKGSEVCIYKVYIVYSYHMCEKFQRRKVLWLHDFKCNM